MNTASDESDTSFVLANLPPDVEITSPADGHIGILNQTTAFTASVYDPDTGSGEATAISWYSNLDGHLGNGDGLSISTLTAGTHLISVFASDGAGGIGVDTILVSIYENADTLPPLPDLLSVGPAALVIDTSSGVFEKQIAINNLNNIAAVSWEASSEQPWVVLSAAEGITPDMLTVSFDLSMLDFGTHYAVIKIVNPANPSDTHIVRLTVVLSPFEIYIPIVLQED
jgi:hypothetical protein